jgi:uncharacterized protein YndB with AHSA1/START domain
MAAARKGKPISDAAVKAKTGKDWAGWFARLDRDGAARMSHAEIATHLHEKRKVPGWWCQMVAVRYEQERGLRTFLQTCRGDFAATGSRTLAAPLPALFRAVSEEKGRRSWCPDAPLEVTKATPHKSVRARWGDGKGRVSFNFFPAPNGKVRFSVDHMGIGSEREAKRMKAWWAERLDRLQERVEA